MKFINKKNLIESKKNKTIVHQKKPKKKKKNKLNQMLLKTYKSNKANHKLIQSKLTHSKIKQNKKIRKKLLNQKPNPPIGKLKLLIQKSRFNSLKKILYNLKLEFKNSQVQLKSDLFTFI